MAFGLLSVPSYIIGVVLLYFFAVKWGWFPAISKDVSLFDNPGEHFRAYGLPVITLAVAQIAIYMRLLRTDMLATLQMDFITMARAKGMSTRHILFRHAFRPSLFSLITAAAVNVGALIGGAVIVEQIFALNGMGQLTVEAIGRRDFPVVQVCVTIFAVVVRASSTSWSTLPTRSSIRGSAMQELSHSHGHTLDPSTQDTPLFGAEVDLAPGEIMPLGVLTDSLDEAYVKPKKRGRVTFWIAAGWLALVIFLAVFADYLPFVRLVQRRQRARRQAAALARSLDGHRRQRARHLQPLGVWGAGVARDRRRGDHLRNHHRRPPRSPRRLQPQAHRHASS